MSEPRLPDPSRPSDAARLLLAASRERFSIAAIDVLLPGAARLTEWQRLTAAALLAQLIRTVEDPLRTALADHFAGHDGLHAAFSSAHVPIALPILERAAVLRNGELGTVLVRRVEEHRFFRDREQSRGGILAGLVGDDDEAVAAEAMAVLVARSRRLDRFHEPSLAATDLPAELQHRLVWMVAAALRQYMVQHHALVPGEADDAIARHAGAMIADYDEGTSLEARAFRLAGLLDSAGRIDDALLVTLVAEGELPLFLAAVALRAGLDPAAAWEVLSDPRGRGPALLLRVAGLGREAAAAILLELNREGRVFSGGEGDAAARQLDLFDSTDADAAASIIRLWQVDPGYRAAVARLSTRLRSVEAA